MENKYFWRPFITYLLNEEDIPKVFNIWNGILRARDIAKRKAEWRVRNGNGIRFWQDNWLIQGPLINNSSFDRWENACIQKFGTKVSDYKSGKD